MLRRVEAAVACGARCVEPLYLPTGGVGRYGPSEASLMGRLLAERGVAPASILLEETGTDTLSSVRAVARMVRERRLTAPVLVATSGYHLARCVMLLRMAGIEARACPALPSLEPFWRRWYWRLRELPAVAYDVALMVGLRVTGRV